MPELPEVAPGRLVPLFLGIYFSGFHDPAPRWDDFQGLALVAGKQGPDFPFSLIRLR
jgi:hypothetical protein